MKGIKFRGINKGRFVYGYYVSDGDSYHAIVSSINNLEMKNTPVIDKTVGQFSGVLDENKSEMFEDDIIECEQGVTWLVSKNKAGCFVARDPVDELECFFLDDYPFMKKGNTHENPELIPTP
tara:strand:- start:233 stop:598 length:366 start_codon:yes stop_codon:yes gene_type:complete